MRTIALVGSRVLLGCAVLAGGLLAPAPASAASPFSAYLDFLTDIAPKMDAMTTDPTVAEAQDILDYLDANPPAPCYAAVWLDTYAVSQLTLFIFSDAITASDFMPHLNGFVSRLTTDLTDASEACEA